MLEWDYPPAVPAGGALAGQARCARGGRVPVEEPCTRRPEGGKPAVIPPSGLSLFPHGACFVGGFTIQWMKGRVVVIQVVRTTLETLSHMNFYSRGGCFFRFSHRLCDSGIVDGVPQRAVDARLNMSRQRLSLLPSPPGKVSAAKQLTDEGKLNFRVSLRSHTLFSCLPLRGRCQTRSV